MRKSAARLLLLGMLCSAITCLQAQSTDTAAYDPHELFTQTFTMTAGNGFRSAKGVPGPHYWQNNASYLIHATFSEQDTSVMGDVTISYTNNSPDSLDYLWLYLDQNIFKSSSRAVAATKYPGDYMEILGAVNGGYEIKDVSVTQGEQTYAVTPIITDTRMQLRLARSMAPGGGKVSIKMKFR